MLEVSVGGRKELRTDEQEKAQRTRGQTEQKYRREEAKRILLNQLFSDMRNLCVGVCRAVCVIWPVSSCC